MESKVIKLPIFDIDGHIEFITPNKENIKEILLYSKYLTLVRKYACECDKDDEDKTLGKEIREINSVESIPKNHISNIGYSLALDVNGIWILKFEVGNVDYTYNYPNEGDVKKAYNTLIEWLFA